MRFLPLCLALSSVLLVGPSSVYAQASDAATDPTTANTTAASAASSSSDATTNTTNIASTVTPTSSSGSSNISAISAISTMSSSSINMTASSNFTLPTPNATATWPAGLTVQTSTPYEVSHIDLVDLSRTIPSLHYTLANESLATRQAICDRQTSFCKTAGCATSGATVEDNFCDVDTLATKCTCTEGGSNLNQYNWPVQLSDCQNRAIVCNNACLDPWTTTGNMTSAECRTSCNSVFKSTCGTPGQVSANYAVSKQGKTPSYNYIQGDSTSGASTRFVQAGALVAVPVLASLLLAIASLSV